MDVSLKIRIREHLAEYLTGNASLDDFKDWLIGATWEVEKLGEPDAVELTFDTKMELAEHPSERFLETELRDRLRSLLPTPGTP